MKSLNTRPLTATVFFAVLAFILAFTLNPPMSSASSAEHDAEARRMVFPASTNYTVQAIVTAAAPVTVTVTGGVTVTEIGGSPIETRTPLKLGDTEIANLRKVSFGPAFPAFAKYDLFLGGSSMDWIGLNTKNGARLTIGDDGVRVSPSKMQVAMGLPEQLFGNGLVVSGTTHTDALVVSELHILDKQHPGDSPLIEVSGTEREWNVRKFLTIRGAKDEVDGNTGVALIANVIALGGKIGIGTQQPEAELDVDGKTITTQLEFYDAKSPDDSPMMHVANSANNERYLWIEGAKDPADNKKKIAMHADHMEVLGRVTIQGLLNTQGPIDGLSIYDAKSPGASPRMYVANSTANQRYLWIEGAKDPADNKKKIIVQADYMEVQGQTATNILEIRGGSDLAEPFEISGSTVIPGMVVSIDPTNPGNLRVTNGAYDRAVAGVISGAGGLQPGLTMQQPELVHGETHPVALAGRVYVWVDATYGAIQPGDLLTTSDTPGHAMKVNDYERGHGAILGKAMGGLPSGRGLVLVLVSLQ